MIESPCLLETFCECKWTLPCKKEYSKKNHLQQICFLYFGVTYKELDFFFIIFESVPLTCEEQGHFTGLERNLWRCPWYRTKLLFYYIRWFIISIWPIKYRVPNTKRRYDSTSKLLIVNFSINSNFKNIWWKSKSTDSALLFYVYNNCRRRCPETIPL